MRTSINALLFNFVCCICADLTRAWKFPGTVETYLLLKLLFVNVHVTVINYGLMD